MKLGQLAVRAFEMYAGGATNLALCLTFRVIYAQPYMIELTKSSGVKPLRISASISRTVTVRVTTTRKTATPLPLRQR